MLNTELLGDPAACRKTGEWMKQVATGVFDAATVIREVRSRTHGCWRGDAANAFEEHVGRGGREADQLSAEIEHAGGAMIAFSVELDTVDARLQQARAVATEVGLTVTAQGIEPPPTVVLPAEPTTPQQAAAVESHQLRVRAWNEVNQTVSFARGVELAAHERLAVATNVPTSMFASLRSNAAFIAAGFGLGVAQGLYRQNSRFRTLSGRHARESLVITRRLAGRPTLSQAQRTQLQSGRDTLLDRAAKENRIAHSQSRLLGGLNRTTPGSYLLHGLAAAPADKIQSTNLFARSVKVVGKVPYAGAVLTGGQAAWDIRQGKPADQALGSAVISTGVGAGVTGVMLAAAPIALAGGPFTLAAVGVGAAAACGVGYVVDNHWDDIKDFSGDTAETVRGGVATAARTVGGWLGG